MLDFDELVADLARYSTGVLSEGQVRSRHRLSDADWVAFGQDEALVRACEMERLRQLRSGQTKRELAQNEIIAAPPILAGIMKNPDSNARHVVDAIKTLDSLTGGGGEAAAATRFSIVINLTADGSDHIERFNKSIAVDVNDVNPDNPDTADVVAAIAMDKARDDGGGSGHI